jgi:hypothetical protein
MPRWSNVETLGDKMVGASQCAEHRTCVSGYHKGRAIGLWRSRRAGIALVQLIYYAHSYRPADDDVNEFFQELMVDEGMTPSLDPKSDRLNAAKPERHLRSTDAMVAVITRRDPAPSDYIRWEVGLGTRALWPQLVFIEDNLADDIVPAGILQRRFSRRGLLRQARDQRYAIRMLKGYIGDDPPPSYQPPSERRRCVVIGSARLAQPETDAVLAVLDGMSYRACLIEPGERLPEELDERNVRHAALCIAFAEGLTPSEYYLLGVARSALTPTVLLTHDAEYPFHPTTPREYQPRYIPAGAVDALRTTIETEIEIFEEDYLELTEEKQVKRYKAFQEVLLRTQREVYSEDARRQVINFMGNAEVDMSKDKIQVTGVVGPVNIKSRLDNVVQTVQQTPGLQDARRQELESLIVELRASLEVVAEKRPEDAERVAKTTELVVAEVTKPKPDRTFLNITTEGLTQAAKAVADIAPTVLAVAAKIAAFVAAL